MLDHYLSSAYQGALLLAPQRRPIGLPPRSAGVTAEPPADEAAALAWYTAEHQVLLALVQRAGAAGFDDHAWRLAWSLAGRVGRCGPGCPSLCPRRCSPATRCAGTSPRSSTRPCSGSGPSAPAC
jgi:hypothetical protein